MKRRNFITVVGGGLVQAAVGGAATSPVAIPAASGKKARKRVRPGDAEWPGAAEWEKLRAAVDGNLIRPKTLFASCAADANGADCADVMKNMRNPFYISDQPGGTEVSGWLATTGPRTSPPTAARSTSRAIAASSSVPPRPAAT